VQRRWFLTYLCCFQSFDLCEKEPCPLSNCLFGVAAVQFPLRLGFVPHQKVARPKEIFQVGAIVKCRINLCFRDVGSLQIVPDLGTHHWFGSVDCFEVFYVCLLQSTFLLLFAGTSKLQTDAQHLFGCVMKNHREHPCKSLVQPAAALISADNVVGVADRYGVCLVCCLCCCLKWKQTCKSIACKYFACKQITWEVICFLD